MMVNEYYLLNFCFVNGHGMMYQAETTTEILKVIRQHNHEGASFTVKRVIEYEETQVHQNLLEAGLEE